MKTNDSTEKDVKIPSDVQAAPASEVAKAAKVGKVGKVGKELTDAELAAVVARHHRPAYRLNVA